MGRIERLTKEHVGITRRYFIKLGAVGAGAVGFLPLWAGADEADSLLAEAVSKLEYLTREEDFISYGRGDPPPHTLPVEKKREVGLVRETWQLEVLGDPESNARIEQPLSKEEGTAMDFEDLMKLGEEHAVRFMSVTACNNRGGD